MHQSEKHTSIARYPIYIGRSTSWTILLRWICVAVRSENYFLRGCSILLLKHEPNATPRRSARPKRMFLILFLLWTRCILSEGRTAGVSNYLFLPPLKAVRCRSNIFSSGHDYARITRMHFVPTRIHRVHGLLTNSTRISARKIMRSIPRDNLLGKGQRASFSLIVE